MIEYHPSYAARVRDLSIAGLKDAEIARVLCISLTTLKAWGERYPEFETAWKDGKLQADAKVVGALFKRACGYTTTKWKETKDGMFQEQVVFPADVAACKFWLTSRRPDEWKADGEGAGSGTPIEGVSEMEAARRIAFALYRAAIESDEGSSDGKSSKPTPE